MNDKPDDFVVIPPEAWGPGCKVDFQNSRLIAPDGTVYDDVRISREDLMRVFSPRTKPGAAS